MNGNGDILKLIQIITKAKVININVGKEAIADRLYAIACFVADIILFSSTNTNIHNVESKHHQEIK